MQKENFCSRFQKNRIKAFTLLEALVALLVMSGSLLVFEGLSRHLAYDMTYQTRDRTKDWIVFSEQLRRELDQSQLVKVEANRVYVLKGKQELAFGQSKRDDFRKTNWSHQGYQPMLQGLKESQISLEHEQLTIEFVFETGLERTFIYDFKDSG